MSDFNNARWLQAFEAHLIEQGYRPVTIKRQLSTCEQFLCYIQQQGIAAERVTPTIFDTFLTYQVQRYRQRNGHDLRDIRVAQHWFGQGVPGLLRFVQGRWPPTPLPANDLERFHWSLRARYTNWLDQCRGLSAASIKLHHQRATQLLTWLGERASAEQIGELSIKEMDGYFTAIAPHYCRQTRVGIAYCVRHFLRYLYHQDIISQDLAATVEGPSRYALEDIPPALKPEDIDRVLALARGNRTPVGIRNYAILLLLAHYGLRSGEVVRLRLKDIDWHRDQFHIYQSKSGKESLLPLLSPVGNALLDYVQHARPQTAVREVFVCAYAPHRPLSSLHYLVSRVLDEAGIDAEGRRGPHTFRHARAVSLLRQNVSLKTISDILGHRSALQTRSYLKLATDDLRDVALELPDMTETAP